MARKKSSKSTQGTKSPASRSASKALGAIDTIKRQEEVYGQGVGFLNSRKFTQAVPYFEAVESGPDAGLRHRARVHLRICNRHIQDLGPKLESAEDYYNVAVTLVNDRKLDEADKMLASAQKLEPKGAHILYLRAVAAALRGDLDDAAGRLSKAIELDPQIRLTALADPDFSDAVQSPEIEALLKGDDEDAAAG